MAKNRDRNRHVVDMVRFALGDNAEKNRLLGYTLEFSDENIIIAAQLAADYVNDYGAFKTGYTIESCPISMLVKGTIVYLYKAKISEKARNTLIANDGGIATNREGNLQIYQSILQGYEGEFITMIAEHKTIENIRNAWRI